MAISKDDTVLTYSKFKEFWTQFAVLFNKKLDGSGIRNNDTTTDEGYVLDARVGKVHGDEIDVLKEQMNGIYLATNSAGKWGFKTSRNGAVTPFRQPVGTATAGDVLTGKTFANSSSDSLTGTMPNNGSMTATLTPSGNNTATKTFAAGYYTGGTVTANGSTAYNAGITAADARTNTSSASYKAGYSAGNTAGYNTGYSAGQTAGYYSGVTQGRKDVVVLYMVGKNNASDVSATIPAGTYCLVYMYKAYENYTKTGAVTLKVGSATYFTTGDDGEGVNSDTKTFTLPAGTATLHVTNGANNSMYSGVAVLYRVI